MKRVPRSALNNLYNNTEQLREVVLFHVVPGNVLSQDLTSEQLLETTSPKGRKLRVNIYNHGADMEVGLFMNT